MNIDPLKLRRLLAGRGILIVLVPMISLVFAVSCGDDGFRGDETPTSVAQSPLLPAAAQATALSAPIDWIRQFGTASADTAEAVASDGGGIYVVGTTDGSLDGQRTAENVDAYVQKHDTSGELRWTRQIGTDGTDEARAVAAADGSVFVVGTTGGAPGEMAESDTTLETTDGFVRKYDPQGKVVWTRRFDFELSGISLNDTVHATTVYGDTLYVVGESTSPASRPARARSMAFIQSYSVDGEAGWSDQFFVDDRSSRAWDVAANGNGVYVSGDTPVTTSATLSNWDAFVRKYDPSGSWKFTRLFDMNEQAGPDTAVSVVVDDLAAYIIGESFQTVGDSRRTHFVRKLDGGGNFEWTRFLQKPPRAIAVDGGMLYLASGTPPNLFAGKTREQNGVDIQKFDTTGQLLWTQRLSASGPTRVNSLAVSGQTLYVAGSTDGAFAGKTNAGGRDAFVARLIEPTDPKRRRR